MNKDTARDYLPLVQALADGKVIQVDVGDGDWVDTLGNEVQFGSKPSDYRIKPELDQSIAPDEVWVVIGPFNDNFTKEAAERIAKDHIGGTVVCYRRADLAGEVS